MKTKIYFILFCNLAISLSCCLNKDNFESEELIEKVEITQLTVEPQTILLKTYGQDACTFMVILENNKRYTLPLKWISGFDHEEGYEYTLKVKKVSPSHIIYDAPQSFYYLLEVLSKSKATDF